jgi:hypothetical protein
MGTACTRKEKKTTLVSKSNSGGDDDNDDDDDDDDKVFKGVGRQGDVRIRILWRSGRGPA